MHELCHHKQCSFNIYTFYVTNIIPGPVADLHSKILDVPPRGPNSFNFMQFPENMAKSYVGVPPPRSWHPLLGQIMDAPLRSVAASKYISDTTACLSGDDKS